MLSRALYNYSTTIRDLDENEELKPRIVIIKEDLNQNADRANNLAHIIESTKREKNEEKRADQILQKVSGEDRKFLCNTLKLYKKTLEDYKKAAEDKLKDMSLSFENADKEIGLVNEGITVYCEWDE